MPDLNKPNPEFQKHSYINNMDVYRQMWKYADEEPEKYWDGLAKQKIDWIQPYNNVINKDKAPFYSWFEGGKLNITDQCIDRHLNNDGSKTAIIWESESGKVRKISYKELSISVNKFANLLVNDFGIKKGDRVVIYMPMIPETIFTMLACARIGAVHVVVFGGFSADVLHERILDTEASLVITVDGSFRRGKSYTLKTIVDEALENTTNKKVLMIKHNFQKVAMLDGRDYDYYSMIERQSPIFESEPLDSEDAFFILHTSGSTGKPKGIKHTTAGYILWAQYTTEIVFDLKKNDIFWCTADVGWITGHTYGVYGPLAVGATILMYEGVPTHPNAGRWWNIIEKHKVTQFYTAPTAIRLLRKVGPDEPMKYNLSSLKVLGTVGEPMDPETWGWYSDVIGDGRCPVVDTWWQTETGGHIISPLPGATPTKPGSVTLPLPGIKTEILDINGNSVSQGEQGFLCITKPWPSMFRSIWQDNERYVSGYFDVISGDGVKKHIYFSGDGAFFDENGYITVTGRMDDVMNVSGHRVSSSEIESSIISHAKAAEVAVVGRPDEISGENIVAFVVTNDNQGDLDKLEILSQLNTILAKKIGPIIKINKLVIVEALPKTRSGKVLRRILRSIAHGEQSIYDLSTIEDPACIDQIQKEFDEH